MLQSNSWKPYSNGLVSKVCRCGVGKPRHVDLLQRTTGNNSGKRNMQIGSRRGNLLVDALFAQLPTALRNRWKTWSPEDFPLLILFHPSPVRWAWHLWMSLQFLPPHICRLIRSTFGMISYCGWICYGEYTATTFNQDVWWICNDIPRIDTATDTGRRTPCSMFTGSPFWSLRQGHNVETQSRHYDLIPSTQAVHLPM